MWKENKAKRSSRLTGTMCIDLIVYAVDVDGDGPPGVYQAEKHHLLALTGGFCWSWSQDSPRALHKATQTRTGLEQLTGWLIIPSFPSWTLPCLFGSTLSRTLPLLFNRHGDKHSLSPLMSHTYLRQKRRKRWQKTKAGQFSPTYGGKTNSLFWLKGEKYWNILV